MQYFQNNDPDNSVLTCSNFVKPASFSVTEMHYVDEISVGVLETVEDLMQV